MSQLLNGSNLSAQAWNHCMSLARRCSNMRQLEALHATFLVHGICRDNNYALSRLVSFCALSPLGSLSYASRLFSQIESPNSFIYNTLIRAYSRSTEPHSALHYLDLMRKDGKVSPDYHTFHFVLLACVNACWMRLGGQIHNWVVKNGLAFADRYIQTAILRLYAEGKEMGSASKLFDEIPDPDIVQWNVLMNGYIRCDSGAKALCVFHNMLVLGVEPDDFCVTTALTAAAQSGALRQGKWIHEYVKRRRWLEEDVFLGTALVDMYAKCGCISMAMEIFEQMPKRNAFSWAAMIGGFAIHGFAKKAIQSLENMETRDGIKPDGVVLLGVLMACTHAGLQEEGQMLLNTMEAKYGIAPKHEHYSCVVDLLCKAGRLDEAVALIKRMPMKPRASVWGALLSSCRTYKNIEFAELAVKELVRLEVGVEEEYGALIQLSNIYLSEDKSDEACRIRRMVGDRGMKKAPGCSMIEVDGMVNEFVSGDVKHDHLAQIHAILELLFVDSYILTQKNAWM